MDLIMGRFADRAIAELGERDLSEFERLIELPDGELLAWITGEADVPPNFDTALFRSLRDLHAQGAEQ